MAQEWTHVDKTAWGDGPWQYEPDKIQWVDSGTDLDCIMVRNEHSGHWCGYVGVPPEHPLHGKDYEEPDVEVHGGLSFAAACEETAPEGHGICHIPEPGRPEDVWWFGFDCCHAGDLAPGIEARYKGVMDLSDRAAVYRDRVYVTGQCAMLAQQLKEIK